MPSVDVHFPPHPATTRSRRTSSLSKQSSSPPSSPPVSRMNKSNGAANVNSNVNDALRKRPNTRSRNGSPTATTTTTTTTTTATTTTKASSSTALKNAQRNGSSSKVTATSTSVWTKFEVPRKIFHSSMGFVTIWGYTSHQHVPTLVKIFGAGLGIISTVDFIRLRSASFNRFYTKVLGFLMRPSEQNKINGVVWYLCGVIIVLTILPRDLATMSILILSWCDTSASIFGRIFGKYTPAMRPRWIFAERKSLAGTLAAAITGAATAYVFFGRLALLGNENDSSWLGPSGGSGLLPVSLPFPLSLIPTSASSFISNTFSPVDPLGPFIKRLPSPNSTLSLGVLSSIVGAIGGFAEAIDFFGLDDNISLPVSSGLAIWAVLSLLK